MKLFFKILVLMVWLLISTATIKVQAQPHPNNGGTAPTSVTNSPVGAGANLTDGSFILLALALAYAGRKVYVMHSKTAKY